MPQVTKAKITAILLIAGMLFLFGCGSSTPNSKTVYDADSGHSDSWLPAGHMVAAQADVAVCTECHGSNYMGGISGVSCTKCHLGGPVQIHPADWFDPQIWSRHAGYAESNGTAACANAACHGAELSGVDASGPSCTSCHMGGVASFHPQDWTQDAIFVDHANYAGSSGSTACANTACHGPGLEGVTGSGPACSSCHTSGSYPFTATGCVSCHGQPPTGTAYPNIKGAHAKHNELQHVTGVCGTCHSGTGVDTPSHFDGIVEVAFLNSYNARSGNAQANTDGTCSEVSCHGGQKTPVWTTGALNVDSQCGLCHESGTTEYNSYFSGEHDFHVSSLGLSCTDCHDTVKLAASHFTTLYTTTMEGPASATLLDSAGYNGSTCTNDCHGTKSWF